ncbi:MAG: hypothetical protein R2755_27985 [Acidimicrobiales bacterium]
MLRRLHRDFLMRSRLEQATLLHTANASATARSPQDLARRWRPPPSRPGPSATSVRSCCATTYTDAPTVLAMAYEQHRWAGGSFFFRLSTFEPRGGRRMPCGFHVGYHFEEVATYAKRHGLIHAAACAATPAIADELATNLEGLRRRSGLPLDVLASHGDWEEPPARPVQRRAAGRPALRDRLGVRWGGLRRAAGPSHRLPVQRQHAGGSVGARTSRWKRCWPRHPRLPPGPHPLLAGQPPGERDPTSSSASLTWCGPTGRSGAEPRGAGAGHSAQLRPARTTPPAGAPRRSIGGDSDFDSAP